MINIVWPSFPGFLIAFVMKRLLYVEIRVFRKKKKREYGGVERPEWVTTHFRVSFATEFSGPVLRQWLSVMTGFGLG